MLERATYRQPFTVTTREPFTPLLYGSPDVTFPSRVAKEKQKTVESELDQHIKYLDSNWKSEGLSSEWFRLRSKRGRQIGFSMNTQMDLLGNATTKESVAAWVAKTTQDLRGFKLEYLSDHIVYPCIYERSKSDPTRLENSSYGNTDIIDTVSTAERNGTVRQSLQEMKSFFLSDDTPDGSIAVMTSPKGETGLKTDDGRPIQYPDSYFFLMVKDGDTVRNFTLKTDFSLSECRDVIARLTGTSLPADAPIEEYVRNLAKIKPGDHDAVATVNDVIGVLESVRPEHAFSSANSKEKVLWRDVYQDILQSDQLYAFSEKTTTIIDEFEAYCSNSAHTKEDYQKALAATILRMSKVFFLEEQSTPTEMVPLLPNTWSLLPRPPATYGEILFATAQRPGCAGGGGESFMSHFLPSPGGVRRGQTEWFTCPKCHYKANGPVGDTCPSCGVTKQEFAEEGGEVC